MPKIYRTVSHVKGWEGLPQYEIKEDGKIYRTVSHVDGWQGLPQYEIKKNKIPNRFTCRWLEWSSTI